MNRRSVMTWGLAGAGLLAAAAIAPGCNIVAPIVYAFSPPQMKPAEHALADRPTVIYVDDRRNLLGFRSLRRRIADVAIAELMDNEVLTPDHAINSRDALAVVEQNDRHSEPMPIDAIGAAVGAEQIIYVEVVAATQSMDGYTAQPGGILNVRVIDVVNKQRLFPVASDDPTVPPSHQLRVIARRVGSPAATGGTSQIQLYEMLAMEMGSQLAKLFYEHNVEKLGTNLKTR